MSDEKKKLLHKLDKSALLTVIGIILLFAGAVVVTLLAPQYVDPSWTSPSSAYQVQMYTHSDPNVYLSTSRTGGTDIQLVYHLGNHRTLLAFRESDTLRIVAPEELHSYITAPEEKILKLTNRLLLLRQPEANSKEVTALRRQLQEKWRDQNPNWHEKELQLPRFTILELYDPGLEEAFALANTDGIVEDWVDHNYELLLNGGEAPWDTSQGTIYISNPMEYRVRPFRVGSITGWRFDEQGDRVGSIEHLRELGLGFLSRRELITMGEAIYREEGCWYCHTQQSRTLVEDCVLNGSERYPAPPSSANEYIFEGVTMPGTRRIGPDLSRVAIKRPARDWHLSHFWSPKTQSPGTIMPRFQHFFDTDPRGSPLNPYGVPNWRFEAVYQYLMTMGSRITPPSQAWWQGKDPVNVLAIINGEEE